MLNELHKQYETLIANRQTKEARAIKRKINYHVNKMMIVKPSHDKPLPTDDELKEYLLDRLSKCNS